MKKIEVAIVNAFSKSNEGGNPAGVVYNSERLTQDEKLALAARISLSETAFASASDKANIKLEFFTPTKQIPHCGHATIGAFCYLKNQGIINERKNLVETIDGLVEVILNDDGIFMEQASPTYSELLPEDLMLALESLEIGFDQTRGIPRIVSTGNSFLLIPLEKESDLKNIKIHSEGLIALSRKYNLIGCYPFNVSNSATYDASARMFAPYYGIDEESATGMAAGPLACYLYDHMNMRKEVIKISQGTYMDSPTPSEIIVKLEVDDNGISKLYAGGKSRLMQTLEIEI